MIHMKSVMTRRKFTNVGEVCFSVVKQGSGSSLYRHDLSYTQSIFRTMACGVSKRSLVEWIGKALP